MSHELPTHLPITPESFQTKEFDVEEFLATHSQFETLNDTLAQVSQVVGDFEAKMLETVSDQFFKTTKQLTELQETPELLVSAQSQIKDASDTIALKQEQLESKQLQISEELQQHKQLSILESQAQQLQYMFDLLSEIELNSAAELSKIEVIRLAKSFVALFKLTEFFPNVRVTQSVRAAIPLFKENILNKLGELTPDLDVLTAYEFVRGVNV